MRKKPDTAITGIASLCVKEFGSEVPVPPHISPIYATSSFEFSSIDQGINIFSGKEDGHVYGRYGNPGLEQVASKVAELESWGTDMDTYGLMCSSGMSAISTLLLAICKPGDRILTQGNLYGGTTELMNVIFEKLDIKPVFTDLRDLERVEKMINQTPDLKLVFMETPANPTLDCLDLNALSAIAKKHGLLTVVDNTVCTPYLQQPFRYGIDAVIHSTTKYLNGHGNAIAGVIVVDTSKIDPAEIWRAMKLLGTNANPFDAWLTHMGMKTLALRMDQHGKNALEIAKRLDEAKAVNRVNYPGLPAHAAHKIASGQMRNFGGMLSFELTGGLEAGIRFMNAISFCSLAPTFGDVDTLILHPASMSHLNVDRKLRESNGITDGLIRLAVGIENVEDIWNDLEQAMAKA